MYTISDYLLDLLNYLNVKDVLGVPGDYNLSFLDHITHRSDMKWRGNMNELNASYMADGYARQNGMAVLVTTFGVGELSAVNGLSGSQAEKVPVLEIVGTPTLAAQYDQKLIHHSLGDGNFEHFQNVHKELGFKVEAITKDDAIGEINQVVKYVYENKQPGYLALPVDLTEMPVNPIFKQLIPSLFRNKNEPHDHLQNIEAISNQLKNSHHPILIIGEDVQRFHLQDVVRNFIINNDIPFADMIESKGIIDETLPQFIGTYNGSLSKDLTNQLINKSDLILLLGAVLTDANTGGFTQSFNNQNTIDINAKRINFYSKIINYNEQNGFVNLIKIISQTSLSQSFPKEPHDSINNKLPVPSDKPITQDFYTSAMSNFIQSDDTVIAEQGTSLFALEQIKFPANVKFICQPLWSSIGFSFPAALGSQLANPKRRNVLSIGEGSLLMTIQEMGFAVKYDLKPIIFVIDNHGYSVERVIHGMHEPYNDVPALNYSLIPEAFGAKKNQYNYFDVKTEKELLMAMKSIENNSSQLSIVRVNMAASDAPEDLKEFGKIIAKQNKG